MTGPQETPRSSAGRLRRFGRTVKSFLFWEHERGSWQYDVMCLLIFLFVVLTPARYFHDKPVSRRHVAVDVVRMDAGEDWVRYRVSAALLAAHHSDLGRAAEEVLAENLDHPFTLTRIEPVRAEDGRIVWYDIWVHGD